ncbi:MAG: 50S ribosomal protein L13 [Bdellovibrionales bacterium RIFOXYD12_FULL_39_22]|nr:MAG: 50S ribosomal protein L13 [Bdellovibrionales bacterium RIFOXYB1_FULL_39_21]OFZ45152.1 MAG: 50S ribosomal protein L13 [Bdellovibrionales bacterium RIFOXYC12_FULL_39_17]OFZ45656.1 MAG: 50S ribosomal protein L13 [Bdellovibrionales bacterium RIFOXYC1_FULL_39_130]OFZ77518.1 MAG: 50S ribosomal protein L13 [Bdellovibrionales bacterium RIFOXYD1_FULL_39_84]OFZ91647.1 MAG: 50S ribosomal protein L13 [Bdellovibrionales bacterium RIFOXYD12_FULL_39_22]HLE11889.1 50S ribosomal protein L13 [Bacteriovo
MYTQKSFVLKPAEAQKKWYLIDGKDMIVGRLATEVARILRGKINPKFTPNTDSGDHVIVINAEKVKFTGNKWEDKNYNWHTNHIGGIKKRTAKEQLIKHPELIVLEAVKGMLPKTTLGRSQLTKLRVVVGESHNHEAQKPEVYNI